MPRWLPTGLGIAAAAAGLLAAAADLVLPLVRWQAAGPGGVETGAESLLQVGLSPAAALAFALLLVVLLALAAAAIADGRSRSSAALGAMWASTLLLLAVVVVTLPSVGVTLAPAALLALLTAGSASLARR